MQEVVILERCLMNPTMLEGRRELLIPKVTIFVGGIEKFVAREYLAAGENQRVPIVEINNIFLHHLHYKVELAIKPTRVAVSILAHHQNTNDASVLKALGIRCETMLFHLYTFLELQIGPQVDFLDTRGYWNIFYIRGCLQYPERNPKQAPSERVLWVVVASWSEGRSGWVLKAMPVGHP